jgi:predicted anti-sigma-YlaC factor YlaD
VWKGLGDNHKCREARALVVRRLDDQLPGPAVARLNARLATCPACRHWAWQEEALCPISPNTTP